MWFKQPPLGSPPFSQHALLIHFETIASSLLQVPIIRKKTTVLMVIVTIMIVMNLKMYSEPFPFSDPLTLNNFSSDSKSQAVLSTAAMI